MNRVSGASAFVAVTTAILALAGNSEARACSAASGCAGMKLVQSASPDESAPDSNSETPPSGENPDDRSGGDNAQSPGDGGSGDDDDNGSNSDQASPPDSGQAPGCVFHDGPLELMV
jgi:hypothetical protein